MRARRAPARLTVHGTPGSIWRPMRKPVTPSACTTAPAVSPPATTSRRTPRVDEAARDLGHDAFDQRAGALAAELLLHRGNRRAARSPRSGSAAAELRLRPGERLPRRLAPAAAASGSIVKTGARSPI